MASGHWQATAPKDNRGEQGGGRNPASPAALRAARPQGARTAARGGHREPQPSEEEVGYPRRGFLGTLFTRGTPDSIGNAKIPVSLGFANVKDLSAGSHRVLHRVGLLLGEPLRGGSLTERAVWKQRESSRGWSGEHSGRPGVTGGPVSPGLGLSKTVPGNDPVPHPQPQASSLPCWEPTGARRCSKHVQTTKEVPLQLHFTDEETDSGRLRNLPVLTQLAGTATQAV